ncbi:hypothetical protein MXAN_1662 [Myxococcus xanthus DK 1622]|uniref:Uncharacterized protein n=1 Tax=Myxococcus xanthus (strain DK1622) TaxID=246197 RepID=Q1DBQ9_MYXXD|nr:MULTISPECIES: hypothetical protein [Myxococcus]ABF88519.1 hypothetical protein MXAN_1662 [Myxococcus xanthus DK 1622]QZZ49186.1 hypothetical protein MyxoNM_08240 [Myxococcus xanthus]UYI16291.1 hypothetical protein N3T43_08210 [Myxococcus xanthus]UYI23654.1 hypothetical protein N1129_08210 [Myxococcus xanthus]SDX28351.1 hypothetical protein SAMN05444383_106339 [Myxococcus xanthus]
MSNVYLNFEASRFFEALALVLVLTLTHGAGACAIACLFFHGAEA